MDGKPQERWTLDTVEWSGWIYRDTGHTGLDWTYKGSDGSVCVSVSIFDSLIFSILRNFETLIHRGTLRRRLYREGEEEEEEEEGKKGLKGNHNHNVEFLNCYFGRMIAIV